MLPAHVGGGGEIPAYAAYYAHDAHGHGAAVHNAPTHGAHGVGDIGDEHGDHPPHDAHAHTEDGHGQHFDPQDMMNMGGLSRRIPVTFITFVIGGLSLAGFPLITAGFWSKDEILADAWYGLTNGYGPQAFVFLLLATAAFLTAFYTARQLCLTFLGEPRTEEAAHAGLGGARSIISITMQLPLVILAVFALIAGFVGVPSEFPILGAIFSPVHNPFFYWTKYTLLPSMQPEHPPFSLFPVLTSFTVALGGLALGYWMYGRKPLKAGEPDPMIAILGPLHGLLKNKYYFDELYQVAVIRPSQTIARITGDWIDRGIIDGILHGIARVFTWIGDLLKVLNLWLIDGFGDGIPQAVGKLGQRLRFLQTGSIQQYLLLLAVFALVIGLIFAASVALAG
jgi:NADH-quinone oxidoreductase subunit L